MMEVKDRIALLDALLTSKEQTGLSEAEVAGLVDFLAGLPDSERESVLEHIKQDNAGKSFERFARLANMELAQRIKFLKAIGIQTESPKGFLSEFFGSTAQSTDRAKQTINEMTEMRQTFQKDFFDPLRKLFGRKQ